MNEIWKYTWIGYAYCAIVAAATSRSNRYIVLGLFALAAPGALLVLAPLFDLSTDRVFETFGYLDIAAAALLIFGFHRLSSTARSVHQGASQVGSQAQLDTLFAPRNETNTFTRAQSLRDDACDLLAARARDAGLDFIEQRSQLHSGTVWFRLEFKQAGPRPELSLRAWVGVDVERFDFHLFEHTYTVHAQLGERKYSIPGVLVIDDAATDRIIAFISGKRRSLRLTNHVRQRDWQFFKPVNKITRFRRDRVQLSLVAAALVCLPIPVIGPAITLLLIAAALFVLPRFRKAYVLMGGRPNYDPRSLRWMDSWQASIKELGPLEATIRGALIARLRSKAPAGTTVGVERIGYWGTDSWIEREQLVIQHRRTIGYIHLSAYADSLYITWESYLNSASWCEQPLGKGIDRVTGLYIVANQVVAGTLRPNEYDVSDVNFLAEWLHDSVKSELKLRMAELKIDQEIDFTIQRESRKDSLGEARQADPEQSRFARGRFRRVA